MPLRGKHPGHRPYRIRIWYTDPKRRTIVKTFHWRGPYEAELEWLRKKPYGIRSFQTWIAK